MFNWMNNHKKLIAFITFMIIFGIPFIIHVLFKLHSNIDFFVAEWTAGELLSYYGSILAFLGTVILGALSLYQNQIIKQESDKRTELLEQRERESNMPRFRLRHAGSQGNTLKMLLEIENISENIANDIILYDVKIFSAKKEILWDKKAAVHLDTIQANNKVSIYLGNPALTEDNCCFKMKMNCNDKYGDIHSYKIWAFCKTPSSTPHFQIEEIKNAETP